MRLGEDGHGTKFGALLPLVWTYAPAGRMGRSAEPAADAGNGHIRQSYGGLVALLAGPRLEGGHLFPRVHTEVRLPSLRGYNALHRL